MSLRGRVALVTGVSRRAGIGFAICKRLAERGADLAVHSWAPYDTDKPWGADPGGSEPLLSELRAAGARVHAVDADLEDAEAPGRLVEEVVAEFGHLDVLIANHTHWCGESLEELSAAEIDRHFAVNVRASLLLAQALARHHGGQPGGRVILMTSGQHRGPMGGELAYAASKGALHQITQSLSDVLADRGVTVNTVNPGPTDTGWISETFRDSLLSRMPLGRIGTPDDAARLIAWLVSDDGGWVTGQVIDSEGGFRR